MALREHASFNGRYSQYTRWANLEESCFGRGMAVRGGLGCGRVSGQAETRTQVLNEESHDYTLEERIPK